MMNDQMFEERVQTMATAHATLWTTVPPTLFFEVGERIEQVSALCTAPWLTLPELLVMLTPLIIEKGHTPGQGTALLSEGRVKSRKTLFLSVIRNGYESQFHASRSDKGEVSTWSQSP